MNTLTHEGYTAEYRKNFNVPSGWPPVWRLVRIVRPNGSFILPTTYGDPGVPASFRGSLHNVRAVREKVVEVVMWDKMTDAERAAWLVVDDMALF